VTETLGSERAKDGPMKQRCTDADELLVAEQNRTEQNDFGHKQADDK